MCVRAAKDWNKIQAIADSLMPYCVPTHKHSHGVNLYFLFLIVKDFFFQPGQT